MEEAERIVEQLVLDEARRATAVPVSDGADVKAAVFEIANKVGPAEEAVVEKDSAVEVCSYSLLQDGRYCVRGHSSGRHIYVHPLKRMFGALFLDYYA